MGMTFDINYRNLNHAYSFACLENNLYLVRQSFIFLNVVSFGFIICRRAVGIKYILKLKSACAKIVG